MAKAKLELGKAYKKITQRASTHMLTRKERSKRVMVFEVAFQLRSLYNSMMKCIENKALKKQGVI